MSWALFIDESGQDRRESPYEVLAGIAIEDRNVWPLIRDLSDAQQNFFGIRLFEAYGREAKAQKLLDRKTFRHAAQCDQFAPADRRALAREILLDGSNPSRERLTALAQAKIEYCRFSLDLARRHGARVFASIVPREAPRPDRAEALRKDYAFLFERFYYFLNSLERDPMGYLVFDELDRSAAHVLLGQVSNYFVRTQNGRTRSRLIIPEPFFVHSDLTTLVQMADIVAYVISWGLRLRGMVAPARDELAPLAELIKRLQFFRIRDSGGTNLRPEINQRFATSATAIKSKKAMPALPQTKPPSVKIHVWSIFSTLNSIFGSNTDGQNSIPPLSTPNPWQPQLDQQPAEVFAFVQFN